MTGAWEDEFQNEINHARLARSAGNEGKARVCARRAAGIVSREFLLRRGKATSESSAYERLQMLARESDTLPEVLAVVDHMLIRVTPEHQLPIDADLIREAEWLAKTLLQE